MKLTDIAISNLKIRRTRMLFLVVGMIIGVATIVALSTLTLSMEVKLDQRFEQQGVRMVASPKSEEFSISYGGVPVTSEVLYDTPFLPLSTLEKLREHTAVGTVAPKLVLPVETELGSKIVVGLEPEAEQKLKPWWQPEQGSFPEQGGIILGKGLADQWDKAPGQEIELKGQMFAVEGILDETGQVEDQLIFINFSDAARLLGADGQVSFIEFNLPGRVGGDGDTEIILQEIGDLLPEAEVSQVKGQQEARKEVVERFSGFAALVSVVVFIIGCLIIMTAMLSSVNERTREIGIFRAIGFRRSHVARIILTEAGMLSLVAGILGYVLGIAAAMIASNYLNQLEFDSALNWNPVFGVLVIITAVIVGILSSLYPAWRASALDPAEALRHL